MAQIIGSNASLTSGGGGGESSIVSPSTSDIILSASASSNQVIHGSRMASIYLPANMPVGTTYTFYNSFVEPTEILNSDGDFVSPLFGLGRATVVLTEADRNYWISDFNIPEIDLSVKLINLDSLNTSSGITQTIYSHYARIYKDNIYIPRILNSNVSTTFSLVRLTYDFDEQTYETSILDIAVLTGTTLSVYYIKFEENLFDIVTSNMIFYRVNLDTWTYETLDTQPKIEINTPMDTPSMVTMHMWIGSNVSSVFPYLSAYSSGSATTAYHTVGSAVYYYTNNDVSPRIYYSRPNYYQNRLTFTLSTAGCIFNKPLFIQGESSKFSFKCPYTQNYLYNIVSASTQYTKPCIQYFSNGYAYVGGGTSNVTIVRPISYV